jgi:hypothetical protein
MVASLDDFLATNVLGDVDDRLGPADYIDSAFCRVIVKNNHATIGALQEILLSHRVRDPHREHSTISVLVEAAEQVHADAVVHRCADVVVPFTSDAAKASGLQRSEQAIASGLF